MSDIDEIHKMFVSRFREHQGRAPTIAEDVELYRCAQDAAAEGYKVIQGVSHER